MTNAGNFSYVDSLSLLYLKSLILDQVDFNFVKALVNPTGYHNIICTRLHDHTVSTLYSRIPLKEQDLYFLHS